MNRELPFRYISENAVRRIIARALDLDRARALFRHEYQSSHPATFRMGMSTGEDILAEMVATGDTRDMLVRELSALDNDGLGDLKALMWIGRNATGEAWEPYLQVRARAFITDHDGDVRYIAEKGPLATYLERGLDYLQYGPPPQPVERDEDDGFDGVDDDE